MTGVQTCALPISLTQEEQKYANIFLHDVQKGDAKLVKGKSFSEYVTEYQTTATDLQIRKICEALGLNESKLRSILTSAVTEQNLNEFGRFDDLKNTVNKAKAREYFGDELAPFEVNIKVQELLKEFVLKGGFDIKDISKQ